MANHEFLRALIRHGRLEALHGYLLTRQATAQDFIALVRQFDNTIPVHVIPPDRLDLLAERAALVIDDPSVATFARARSLIGDRAYTLTGITHTLAEDWIKSDLVDTVAGPVQPWDAVVCTSIAVASMVRRLIETEQARLTKRLGATQFPTPLLPIIPLGVDTDRLTRQGTWRTEWRNRLAIAPADLVVLNFGRLHRVSKAHPLPMLMALGGAARNCPHRVHLILSGWWQYPPEEAAWREQAALLCPNVGLHVLDGRDNTVRREIWSAADIFVSLVDNIQETFGLAPVEAMAAGLPVVVTDWDGFRDTVRHGVDGVLVPTLMAPAGDGLDTARHYATHSIQYLAMLSEVSRMTAVDIRAATSAFNSLFADPGLRWRMGSAGEARAREVFDWSAIIPQHQSLWQEQQAIRATSVVPGQLPSAVEPDPRHMDPTVAFAAWPSAAFSLSQRLQAEEQLPTNDVLQLLNFTTAALPSELNGSEMMELLSELRRRGQATAAELLKTLDPLSHSVGRRALLWLMRAGLIAVV